MSGAASWLSDAQRYRVGYLLHHLFLDIRMAARESDLAPVRAAAAALQDLPLLIWEDGCNLAALGDAVARLPFPPPNPAARMHRLTLRGYAAALTDIAVRTSTSSGVGPATPSVAIEALDASGAWRPVAHGTNHRRTLDILLERASRPWPRSIYEPLVRRPVRAVDLRTGRVLSDAPLQPVPAAAGEGPWLPTQAQRVEICRLLSLAMADIRRAAEWGEADVVCELADLLENLPREMWWDSFYLPVGPSRTFREQYPVIGGIPTLDYAAFMEAVVAMRAPDEPGDPVNPAWRFAPPERAE